MRLGRSLPGFLLVGLVFSAHLDAQTWVLTQGPRMKEAIPLPILWADQVWEAHYSGPEGLVRVYGLGKGPFLLEGGESLECLGVEGSRRTYKEGLFVHLKAGFLLVFPRDYTKTCPFSLAFLEAWRKFQGLSYYRDRITLPDRISTGTP